MSQQANDKGRQLSICIVELSFAQMSDTYSIAYQKRVLVVPGTGKQPPVPYNNVHRHRKNFVPQSRDDQPLEGVAPTISCPSING